MIKLQTLIMNLKREFWENYRMVFLMPIIVSLMMLAAGIGMIIYSNFSDSWGEIPKQEAATELSSPIDKVAESDSSSSDEIDQLKSTSNRNNDQSDFSYMGLYFGISWLVAIFYLLNSLHSDRRDNSVLFWKSMPVSEWESIVSKYIFATLAFSFFTMLIAWGNSVLLYGLVSSGLGESWMNENGGKGFSFMHMFVWPIVIIGITWIWSALWFSWALFCSARAHRSPILLFILVPVLLRVAEHIFTNDHAVSDFFLNHSPWRLLSKMSLEPGLGEFLRDLFIGNAGGWLASLLMAAGLLYAATWNRTHRFESA